MIDDHDDHYNGYHTGLEGEMKSSHLEIQEDEFPNINKLMSFVENWADLNAVALSIVPNRQSLTVKFNGRTVDVNCFNGKDKIREKLYDLIS